MINFFLLTGTDGIPELTVSPSLDTSEAIWLGFFLGVIATLFIVFLYSSIKEIIKNNNSNKDNNEDEKGD